jgi:hypothetical protein
MNRSLLYTSRKTIPVEFETTEIAKILAAARAHNVAAGITGGLVNTRYAFAQLLEGPAKAIDDLMGRISIDRRHTNVCILRFVALTDRKLPGWSMAYSGSWTFVAKRVERLVGAEIESDPQRIDELIELIVKFVEANDDRSGLP